MKIRQVTTAVVEANFDYTYVRIDVDEGASGYGEAFFAPGIATIVRELGELLIGQDPRDVRALLARLYLATSASTGSSGAGASTHAISGIETALWDLNGHLYGVPVWRLLGGSFRTSIPVYADLHAGEGLGSIDSMLRSRIPFWASEHGQTVTGDFYWRSSDEGELSLELITSRVEAAADEGFGCVKLDIDVFEDRTATDSTLSLQDVARIAERAGELRDRIAGRTQIAYDCHWRFDVPAGRALHAALIHADPCWLEDPVRPDSRALAQVAAVGPVAIASGENAYRLAGITELAGEGGLHIATPDVQKVGGLLESVAIADWADRHGIGFAPHCIASPLGFMASAHVMAAAPSVRFLEFHGQDLPFWSRLVKEPVLENGHVALPQTPGLGVTLDLEVAREHAARGEPFFDEGIVR